MSGFILKKERPSADMWVIPRYALCLLFWIGTILALAGILLLVIGINKSSIFHAIGGILLGLGITLIIVCLIFVLLIYCTSRSQKRFRKRKRGDSSLRREPSLLKDNRHVTFAENPTPVGQEKDPNLEANVPMKEAPQIPNNNMVAYQHPHQGMAPVHLYNQLHMGPGMNDPYNQQHMGPGMNGSFPRDQVMVSPGGNQLMVSPGGNQAMVSPGGTRYPHGFDNMVYPPYVTQYPGLDLHYAGFGNHQPRGVMAPLMVDAGPFNKMSSTSQYDDLNQFDLTMDDNASVSTWGLPEQEMRVQRYNKGYQTFHVRNTPSQVTLYDNVKRGRSLEDLGTDI